MLIREELRGCVELVRIGRHNHFISVEVRGEQQVLTLIFTYIPHRPSKIKTSPRSHGRISRTYNRAPESGKGYLYGRHERKDQGSNSPGEQTRLMN